MSRLCMAIVCMLCLQQPGDLAAVEGTDKISTFAGSVTGAYSGDGGPANEAKLMEPEGIFMKVFELGYPFLWKGRKSLACRRQAKRLSYRVQTTETHIDSGCAYFLVVSSPVFDFQG